MKRIRHLKKGDTVVALNGASVAKVGKVMAVKPLKGLVQVEGMGVVKRHTKPSQSNPKGGIVEKNRWLPASKFMVATEGGKKRGRVGFEGTGRDKKRVYSSERK